MSWQGEDRFCNDQLASCRCQRYRNAHCQTAQKGGCQHCVHLDCHPRMLKMQLVNRLYCLLLPHMMVYSSITLLHADPSCRHHVCLMDMLDVNSIHVSLYGRDADARQLAAALCHWRTLGSAKCTKESSQAGEPVQTKRACPRMLLI